MAPFLKASKRNNNMKVQLFALLILLASCTPTVHYFGDAYNPSAELDVFFDEKDVIKPYKVMGHMTHDTHLNYDPEILRTEMEREARTKGADAIIYTGLGNDIDSESSDKFRVSAKLIKYE